jgi:LEA14-like dessication related protein
MKKTVICIIVISMFIISGCSTLQSGLLNAYNLANCNYKYNSINNLKISGMDLSKGFNALMIPKVISILEGSASSIPLDFTLNLDVSNPNSGTAAFQALNYIINIDDIEFTSGTFNQAFKVDANSSNMLPLNLSVDIATLMKKNSRSAIENIVKNFLGISGKSSNVTVKLKPSFKVGEQIFTSPVYIPISFTFGKTK